MTKLWQRAYRVIVNTVELSSDAPGGSLDLAFNITRTLKTEPNTCELKIWNLSEAHRAQLDGLPSVPVQVSAGYKECRSLLFLGALRKMVTVREGPDTITTIASGDGETAKKKRVNVPLGRGTTPDQALRQIILAMGVSEGNAAEIMAGPLVKSKALFAKYGTVLSGQATREMDLLAESLGLEWSIQNGAIQLLGKGRTLATVAVNLTAETGMIGAPSLDSKGVLTGKSLLIPDMFPGRTVVIYSENVKGTFRLEKCSYSGDTAGDAWECSFEGKRL